MLSVSFSQFDPAEVEAFTLIDAGDQPRICHLGPAAGASRWNSLRGLPVNHPAEAVPVAYQIPGG